MIITENETFYPTPKELASTMLYMLDKDSIKSIKTVLEPSAGQGDLIEALLERCKLNYNTYIDIDCIEKDNTLKSTLMGKKYRVIADDFLQFNTIKHYDLILMNPPFNEGANHLLKAINLAKSNGGGTKIVSLLNSETIKNPYSNIRKVLLNELNLYGATIKFETHPFACAERSTDVEVAIVYIDIPSTISNSFIMDELDKAESVDNFDNLSQPNEMVVNDDISKSLAYYNKEVELTRRFFKEYFAIKPYINVAFTNENDDSLSKRMAKNPLFKIDGVDEYSDINKVLEKIRYKYWRGLFRNDDFTRMLTSDMQTELHNSLDEMSKYEYSFHNIEIIKEKFIGSLLNNVEQSIFKLFNELSTEHTWYDTSNNIHYYNGWKTNKAHKINNKVIIPMNGAFAESWSREFFRTYNIVSTITDIEKVFNYLSNEVIISRSVDSVVYEANTMKNSRNLHFKYFDCTFYKKGTCHIKFTNTDVLDALNIYVGRKHNWLPPSYGKVRYDDMTESDKQIIEEFQGRAEYEKVFNNPQKYIIETHTMLALPA